MTTRMRREIEEEPDAVGRLLREGRSELDAVAAAVRAARPRYVAVVARGTSDHAAVYARYLTEVVLGLPAGLAAPSVTTLYGAPVDWRNALLLAISQSGAGPDVVSVVSAARAGGALTVGITNEPGSELATTAELVLHCRAGRELSVAATKTYVTALAAIAGLILRLGERDAELAALDAIPAALAAAIDGATAWMEREQTLVQSLAGANRALVVSRGFNLATALEVALKLKETSRIFADGYSSADLLHGPIVLVEPDLPVVAVRPDGATGASIDAGVEAAARGGAHPWLVGGRELARVPHALSLDHELPEHLTPLVFVVPGQLLAERVALAGGHDPDAPPGLRKVTRTR
jgi:glucosamine--fructose-6-phosphate aminotransferase (isomerizing)